MVAGVVSVSLSSVCYGMKCERETEEKTEKRHLAFYDRMSAFLYEWECKNRREIEKSFEKLRKAENRLDPKDTTNRIAVEYARSQVRQLAKKMKFPALEKKPNKPSSK